MPTQQALALHWLDHACQNLSDHLPRLTLAEALFAPSGGYRSILGTLKHTAGWGHVYRSYAFDAAPVHWRDLDWPRGLLMPSPDD